ncbi:hypothetical protein PC116_g2338 [Phytophthora cactorum]|uniref:Uncharacterized protein n=1 Tax=Phytophthora cactorum TaxID=29920 RepID=A0A8T1E016_9STRA|nr:hypothetical protein Pcac1_g6492 [Phytophthora cactorum]KAG2918155.1 hypothetical protein PC114_g6886 [Phytophthora cactorum]KAG2947376.1 hypothetical protein PC117_g6852 [Phytophthora cactorum]KAG3031156.1 hypothetical protein PC120_g3316 [Phytophthora cactorum]KAG3031315.1 hypothetical protein PC119_g5985 [Phytophthora cactorum]
MEPVAHFSIFQQDSSLACVVVGVGATIDLGFDEGDLAESIPEKLMEKIDEDFDPSRVVCEARWQGAQCFQKENCQIVK